MKSVEYKLLSGDTENRRINVVVDADSTSATICWPYTITLEEDICSSCTYRDTSCQIVAITPNTNCENPKEIVSEGSLVWNNFTIFYRITQKKPICPCKEEAVITNELIQENTWVSPKEVHCIYESKKIKLHYEYYQITTLCGEEVKREIIKKDIPINVECECVGETSDKSGTYHSKENFDINYQYKCIVYPSDCDCSNFDFIDSCNCGEFEFLGGDNCDCDNFEFIQDCDCDDFEFIQDCDCDDFEFEKNCDCDNLVITP